MGAAEKRPKRLFSKNTGLCEVEKRSIQADACPVPEGQGEVGRSSGEDYPLRRQNPREAQYSGRRSGRCPGRADQRAWPLGRTTVFLEDLENFKKGEGLFQSFSGSTR